MDYKCFLYSYNKASYLLDKALEIDSIKSIKLTAFIYNFINNIFKFTE